MKLLVRIHRRLVNEDSKRRDLKGRRHSQTSRFRHTTQIREGYTAMRNLSFIESGLRPRDRMPTISKCSCDLQSHTSTLPRHQMPFKLYYLHHLPLEFTLKGRRFEEMVNWCQSCCTSGPSRSRLLVKQNLESGKNVGGAQKSARIGCEHVRFLSYRLKILDHSSTDEPKLAHTQTTQPLTRFAVL